MWVSSKGQLAGGLTKMSARQGMIEQMSSGSLKLIADAGQTAAKKKTWEQRQRDGQEAFGQHPIVKEGVMVRELEPALPTWLP